MNWTDEHRAFVIETFMKNNESVITTQRTLRTHFALGRHAPVPDRKTILLWVSNFRATDSALKRQSTGRPVTADRYVDMLRNFLEPKLSFECVSKKMVATWTL